MTSHYHSVSDQLDDFRRVHREGIRSILLFFVLSRIIFFVFFFVCQTYIGVEYVYGSLYYQYDGYHYSFLGIHGYEQENLYAFFPLFPLVIRFFALLGIPVAGPVLLNHVLTLCTAVLIYRLVAVDMGKGAKPALYAALFWIFSPLSVSTCVLYSEALFIFLTVGAYALYVRKRPFAAGIFLGLSILARSMGAMLFLAFVAVEGIRLIRSRSLAKLRETLTMLVPAGLLGALYPLYLQIKLGNWHYFVDVQYEHWARAKSNLFDMLYRDISNFGSNAATVVFTYVALAVCIVIITQAIRFQGDWVLILYMVFTILMVFSTARDHGSIGSFSFYRYMFGCSSVYLLMDTRLPAKLLIVVCAAMSIFATAMFCIGGFLI